MADGTIASGPGYGRGSNTAIFRWMWQRYGLYFYFPLLLSFLVPLALMMLTVERPDTLAWPHSAVPGFGIMIGSIASGGAILYQLRDKAASFLLAYPFSRRQVYHALLLGALFLWFFLGVAPNFSALIMSLRAPALVSYRAAYEKEVFFVVYVLCTLSLSLFTIYMVFSLHIPNSRSVRIPHLLVWCVVVILSVIGQVAVVAMNAVATFGPVLAGASLALAVFFYHAGWLLFRNLDL